MKVGFGLARISASDLSFHIGPAWALAAPKRLLKAAGKSPSAGAPAKQYRAR
jgi:hypothetical protein